MLAVSSLCRAPWINVSAQTRYINLQIMSSSVVSSVLSIYKPVSWDNMTPNTEVHLEELDTVSQEFISAMAKIHRTLPVTVHRVLRIQNPYLYGCYLLKKEEYEKRYGSVQEMELFHATGTSNVCSITKYNLDWRRSVRTKFGEGVSFSPDARYANLHCNRSNPTRRAMLIAKVLVHSTCVGNTTMKLPRLSDTSTGNTGSVYVKYSDNEFYPTYVAYYDSPPIPIRRFGRYF